MRRYDGPQPLLPRATAWWPSGGGGAGAMRVRQVALAQQVGSWAGGQQQQQGGSTFLPARAPRVDRVFAGRGAAQHERAAGAAQRTRLGRPAPRPVTPQAPSDSPPHVLPPLLFRPPPQLSDREATPPTAISAPPAASPCKMAERRHSLRVVPPAVGWQGAVAGGGRRRAGALRPARSDPAGAGPPASRRAAGGDRHDAAPVARGAARRRLRSSLHRPNTSPLARAGRRRSTACRAGPARRPAPPRRVSPRRRWGR
jgi:hypothetical protein